MMQSQIVHLPQKGVLVMYIKTVTFEVLAEAKETFSEKIRKDIASMKTFEGCLQSECWINEKKHQSIFNSSQNGKKRNISKPG